MTYIITEIPVSRIVYMRQVGPYGASNNALMAKFKEWAKVNGLLTNSAVIMGITWDNPEITPQDKCRYDVGLVVADRKTITDAEISEAEISGGRYAVFTIVHTAEAVQKAWGEVFIELSANGHRVDGSRPIFERYTPAMVDNHRCEICVPLDADIVY